jgi:hypothetical protein
VHAIPIVPAPSVLPGVDLVVGGSADAAEVDALPTRLRRDAAGAARTLERALHGYDRVVIDVPAAPASLVDAVLSLADHVLGVAAGDGPAPRPPTMGSMGPKPLGVVLNRWCPVLGPDARWLATAIADRDAAWLDTAIPRFASLRTPWDLVDGSCGAAADQAFAALAGETDARIAARSPQVLPLMGGAR